MNATPIGTRLGQVLKGLARRIGKFASARLPFFYEGGLTGSWQVSYAAQVFLARVGISGTKTTQAAYKIVSAQDGSYYQLVFRRWL